MPPKLAKDPSGWKCNLCDNNFVKDNDKVMECEYCENHFCISCLEMTPAAYNYHAKSTAMWFCMTCVPKVKETIKIEKEIEKQCNAHYKKFEKRCDEFEQKIEKKFIDIEKNCEDKCSKTDVESIIDEKLKSLSPNRGEDEVKLIVKNTVTDIVDNTIEMKIAESEKEIADRQSREKNIILFNVTEPNTNIIDERKESDKELIKKMSNIMNFETTEPFDIMKVVRLGKRNPNPQENPRPLIVTLSTLEAKKQFLKNSLKIKKSDDAIIKQINIQNDMTKKDREREYELVKEKFSKNSEVEANWRYVIRGPPGERILIKIRKM